MPDNMNNNGNNITNGYQNTSDDSVMALLNILGVLDGLTTAVNQLSKELKDDKETTEKNSETIKRVSKDFDKYDKATQNTIKALDKVKKSLDDTAKSNPYSKGTNTQADDIKKLASLLNALTDKNKSLGDTIAKLRVDLNNADNKEDRAAIKSTIEKFSKNFNETDKKIAKITDNLKSYTAKAEKEARHNQKVQEARDWKIANNLESCFEGGLENLGKSLTDTFKQSTNNNITAIQRGVVGNLIAFAEKSLVSAIDFQTKEYIKGIDTLQSTFESVGMNITKSILLDRDEVARSWQDVADRLKADNLEKSVSLTDIAQYQETAAKAGITNKDLLESIGYAAAKTSAISGTAMSDITNTENLGLLNSIYTQAVKSGKSNDEARAIVEQAILNIGEQASGVIGEAGTALGLSEGKLNETVTSYLRIIASKGTGDLQSRIQQAGTSLSGSLAAQGIMGSTSGGQSIYQNFASFINGISNKGLVSGEPNEIAGILGGYVDESAVRKARESGDYVSVFTSMIENIGQIVGTNEKGNEIAQSKLLEVFGLSADEYNEMISPYGDVFGLVEAMKSAQEQAQLGSESEEYQRRMGLLTSGETVTAEQGLKNRAVVDAAKAWGLAEESGIPYATEILKDTINTSVSLLESTFTGGIATIYNAIVGNGTASLAGGLGGISKWLGIGGAAIGFGLLLSNVIDNATANMQVTFSQKSIDDLAKIEEQNRAKNDQWKSDILTNLETNNTISKETKDMVASDLEKLLDNRTEELDTKENLGKQIKSAGVSETFKQEFKASTGISYDSASDIDIGKFAWANASAQNLVGSEIRRLSEGNSDISDALTGVKRTTGMTNWNTIDTIMSSAGADIFNNEEGIAGTKYLENYLETMELMGASEDELKKAQEDWFTGLQQLYADKQAWDYAKAFMIDTLDNVNRLGLAGEEASDIAIASKRYGIEHTKYGSYLKDVFDLSSTNFSDGLTLIDSNKGHLAYSPSNVKKFAVGIDYVPYDNYPALLHKGERVLTAADATMEDLENNVNAYSRYSSNNNNTSNNYINELATTNNSIVSGFNTNNANQQAIIEALKTIVEALLTSNNSNIGAIFNNINNDKVALRTNNMAYSSSIHY